MASAPLPNWGRVNEAFEHIAQDIRAATAEFENLQNVTAIQQNNLLQQIAQQVQQIAQQVQQIDTRLQHVETRLQHVETGLQNVNTRLENVDTRLENVDTRLQNIETHLQQVDADFRAMSYRIRANDANSLARTFNSMIVATQTGTRLEPLLSVRTGQPIPSFPATHEELRRLHEPVTNSILSELDIQLPGGAQLSAKKEILRRQCGLTF